jgi:hypothetical protein
MTWQGHVDWNRELVLFVLFLNVSEVVEIRIPSSTVRRGSDVEKDGIGGSREPGGAGVVRG